MSSRRPRDSTVSVDATRLRAELEQLKAQSAAVEVAGTLAESDTSTADKTAVPAYEQLTSTEQAAGSLGVHPESWKPIKFMNNKHFETLIKSNALDDHLARRIDAFRAVAAQ